MENMMTAATIRNCNNPLVVEVCPFAAVSSTQGDSYRTIPLTRGKFAIVDNEDYESLSKHKWYAQKGKHSCYAARNNGPRGKQKVIWMHRQILRPPVGMGTDHRDGDGLNNRKENLRIATNAENIRNSRKQKGCSSKFKGVYWNKEQKKWHARIILNGRSIWLGYFDSEIEAAKAYDRAAIKYFGEFAHTNFPRTDYV